MKAYWVGFVLGLTLLAGSATPSTAELTCTTWNTCTEVPGKIVLRYPGQYFTWYVDSLPRDGAFRGSISNDELKRMVGDALFVYGSLGNTVPNDQTRWHTDAVDYNNRIMWVPQTDLQGGTNTESGIPCAAAYWATSSFTPYCFIVATKIKLAKDPTDGVNALCWQGDWCFGNNCNNGCGNHNVDLLSVLVHEFGHGFGLNDRYDNASSKNTMYGYIAELDTVQRTLTGCEREEISAVYINNPAAMVTGLKAVRTSVGSEVRWSEEVHSEATREYVVSWSADWNSPRTLVATVPVNSAGHYLAVIPGYTDGVVHLDEVELNGRVLPLGDEPIGTDSPVPAFTVEPTNVDSMCTAVLKQRTMLSPTQIEHVQTQAIQSVIAVRDSLRAPAEWLADFWTNWEGVRTTVISIDSLGGERFIKQRALALMPAGGTVKLMGGSWDGWNVQGDPMRMDINNFRNGFTRDSFPNQPQRDVIRTFFTLETGAQRFSLSQGYPWTTSDANYLSRSENGLVDPMYGVGRFPVNNLAEAWQAVWKTVANVRANPQGQVAFLNYLKTYGSCQGEVATVIADSLLRIGWPNFMPLHRIDDSPRSPMSTAQRRAASIATYAQGGLYINHFGTGSSGYAPGFFCPTDGGFNVMDLPTNDGNLPVGLAFTCYGANYAGTENPVYGSRTFKQLYLAPSRGVRAWIGATSGTWLPGDGHLYYLWYLDWLAHPEKKIGIRLADVLRQDVELFPEDSALVREIVLIGDPDLIVPAPSPPVVSTTPQQSTLHLGAYPNPSTHGAVVHWTLPQPQQVHLSVYDVSGRLCETLVQGYKPAGVYTYQWSGQGLPSGTYFLRLKTDHDILTTKLVQVR